MVIVGLELTEFITGAAGKVGPTGVIVLEAGFKVGVLICWHNAETTNCPRRVMTTRNPHSGLLLRYPSRGVLEHCAHCGALVNAAPCQTAARLVRPTRYRPAT